MTKSRNDTFLKMYQSLSDAWLYIYVTTNTMHYDTPSSASSALWFVMNMDTDLIQSQSKLHYLKKLNP
jgi:hypothetical protein